MNIYLYSKRSHVLLTTTRILLLGVLLVLLGPMRTPAPTNARGEQDTQLSIGMQRIPGHLVPSLEHARSIGATSIHQPLNLSIALKLRNLPVLDDLLISQSDPHSPLYHHYLSEQTFTNLFSPLQSSVDDVVNYLKSQHLPVTSVSANRLLVNTVSTVDTTQQAFKTTFRNYQLKNRVVYAPIVEPALPTNLANIVQLIGGLNNVAQYHPLMRRHNLHSRSHHLGPGGGFTPDELRSAYDVQPLLNAGMDGTGQTIALFELDGYKPSDINTYLQQYKLGPPKYSSILVDGASNYAGPASTEVTLDMEVASAIAPGARQQVYIGVNSVVGESDILNKIVSDDSAKIITTSWGECELAAVPGRLDALDNIIKQGAAQGQTFFSASGDAGAYDCNDNNISVDSVASDPYVIGVGGTSLQLNADNSYEKESAWENVALPGSDQVGTGTGGGTSTHFLRHSFQYGRNLTSPYRMVPDVSANADPQTGYSIYCTGADSTGWTELGGTSAAAPFWAALTADLNQYLQTQNQTKGSVITIMTLYQLYNIPQLYPPYHDITTGTNLYYPTQVGYDLATGLGSPDAWNIARDLAHHLVSNLPSNTVTRQLLKNTGFENGNTSWQEQSKGGIELVDPTNPHSGANSAYFCGYINCDDSIAQTVTLPAAIKNVTLSYWVYISAATPNATCPDSFTVSLQTPTGTPISVIQKLCTTSKTQTWTLYSFDVTPQLAHDEGQDIQVVFRGLKSDLQRTNFFLDDTQLNVTQDCSLTLNCVQSTNS